MFGSNEGEHEVILLLGYGMLYNHSAEPNCEYIQDDPRIITFVTIRAGRGRRGALHRLRRRMVVDPQPEA